MKKALCLALAAALLALSACAAPPPAESMENTSAPAAPAGGPLRPGGLCPPGPLTQSLRLLVFWWDGRCCGVGEW